MSERIPSEEGGRSRFPDGFRIMQGKHEYITYIEHSSIRIWNWSSDAAAHYDYHTHSAIEVIMPQRGLSVYYLQDEMYQVHPGEVLILPSGCVHALTEPPETLRSLLLFEPNPLTTLRDMPSIAALMQQPIYLHGGTELQARVNELLTQVVDCYARKEPLWNSQCYSYLLQMYVLLGQQYLRSTAPQHYAEHRSIEPVIMNGAITFINEHYMEDIALEDVAMFVGFSKYYFSRTFKQFSGVSFSEYLTQKRLNVAVDLLVRTGQPIREVARASGFGSSATFNRVFREAKNCTPTQFRAIYGTMLPLENEKPVF